MKSLCNLAVIAAGLFSIGLFASPASANKGLAGTFTLDHPTQWKNTVLAAGDYRFTLARTQTDTNRLTVRGKNQALDMLVFAQSACDSCKSGALQLAVEGNGRAVTSLELPGFHVDFKASRLKSVRREELGKNHTNSEQVAVHVDTN